MKGNVIWIMQSAILSKVARRRFLSNQMIEDLNGIELNRSFFDFDPMALRVI